MAGRSKAQAKSDPERNPWVGELVDLARAASGGMLFGIPLLYTMEVWWIGSTSEPVQILGVLAVCFGIILVLNRTSGFRRDQDVTWTGAIMDAIEALAVGLICVTVVLIMLRELTMATPLGEALGKVVYEATPFAIGIGLAHNFLHKSRADEQEDGGKAEGKNRKQPAGPLQATLNDIGATVIGAVFVAFNIAPTDEIPMIAAALGPLWQVALIVTSLVVSYWIVFESEFASQEQRRNQPGVLQHPFTETVFSYALALGTAAVMLWFFQQFASGAPLSVELAYVVVLGLPAAVGGAAGRLAV